MGTTLPDLDTRSVLDVVEENFQNVGMKTYAMCMVYIGEHTLPREEVIEIVGDTIKNVNAGYCDINVKGVFLVYDSYFLHLIEGSEDTVHRHLRFLFQSEEQWIKKMEKQDAEAAGEDVGLSVIMAEESEEKPVRQMFKRTKLVIVADNIKHHLFTDWRHITARPPSLIGKLDVYGPMQEHIEQLRICLNKITKLCYLAVADPNLSFDGLSAVDPKMEALPEVALMDFLLQSPYILDLRETADLHRRVHDYCFYHELVWPLPTHHTPRLLYKLKIDDSFVEQLPVMSWEVSKKDPDEKEEEDLLKSRLSLIPDVASTSSVEDN